MAEVDFGLDALFGGARGRFIGRVWRCGRRKAVPFANVGLSEARCGHPAMAEKVAHLEHDAWLRRRKRLSAAGMADGLRALGVGGEDWVGDDLRRSTWGCGGDGLGFGLFNP